MSTPEKKIPSSTSEQTQEMNQDQDQPTEEVITYDPAYVQSLEERIANQQIQNRRLEGLIDGIRQSKDEDRNNQPTPQRDLEGDRNRFYQDPIGTFDERLDARDNKILKQMKEMLSPIQEVASSFRTNNEYDNIKRHLKTDPVFGKGLKDPEIEALVDNIMKQPGVIMGEDTVKSAISQAYGMKAMGGFGTRRVNNNDDNDDRRRVDPPTVPSTRTRIEVPATRKELTEDDRLAMRMAKLKPGNPEDEKEYWSLIQDDTMVLDVHKKREGGK